MPINANVYPVAARLEAELSVALRDARFRNVHSFNKLVDMGTEFIQEYEHGTADLPKGITLLQYAGVVEDFIEYMIAAQTE